MAELKFSSKKFKVLQLDGGGILGVMYLKFLSELETILDKQCYQLFDIISGTSTGGVSGALLAKGIPAAKVLNLYLTEGKNIFSPRFGGFLNPKSWFSGKYDRAYLDKLCDEFLSIKMRDLSCGFMVTGVNMADYKSTHFMKSFKPNYQEKLTSEMVKRTYSAPTYFGYYKDEDGEWSDGGVGVMNCTLMESCIEARRGGFFDSHWVLSCGCGHVLNTGKEPSSFIGAQIADFIPIAREQSIWSQISYAKEEGYTFTRVDVPIDKDKNELDAIKYISYFLEKGQEMIDNNIHKIVTF